MKKKAGRPRGWRKPNARKSILMLRCTPIEHVSVAKAAAKAKLSVSDYIRSTLKLELV